MPKDGLCRERPSTIRSKYWSIMVFSGRSRLKRVGSFMIRISLHINHYHHFFDTDTGELGDIEAEQFEILGMPEPPPSKSIAGADVVVRLKSTG